MYAIMIYRYMVIILYIHTHLSFMKYLVSPDNSRNEKKIHFTVSASPPN